MAEWQRQSTTMTPSHHLSILLIAALGSPSKGPYKTGSILNSTDTLTISLIIIYGSNDFLKHLAGGSMGYSRFFARNRWPRESGEDVTAEEWQHCPSQSPSVFPLGWSLNNSSVPIAEEYILSMDHNRSNPPTPNSAAPKKYLLPMSKFSPCW